MNEIVKETGSEFRMPKYEGAMERNEIRIGICVTAGEDEFKFGIVNLPPMSYVVFFSDGEVDTRKIEEAADMVAGSLGSTYNENFVMSGLNISTAKSEHTKARLIQPAKTNQIYMDKHGNPIHSNCYIGVFSNEKPNTTFNIEVIEPLVRHKLLPEEALSWLPIE